MEGAEIRRAPGCVELLDEQGTPKVRVSAPEAYLASGEAVEARLDVRGSSIELWIDTKGQEALIDPVWRLASPMPSGTVFQPAILLKNGKVFIPTPGALYDPPSNTWSPTAPTLFAHDMPSAALLADGRVLLSGGYDLASAEIYNPASNTWIMPADGVRALPALLDAARERQGACRRRHTARLRSEPQGRPALRSGDQHLSPAERPRRRRSLSVRAARRRTRDGDGRRARR
ncbi:MAG: hypothetical protein U0359_08070 [Byssovorax sp.]